MKCFGYTTELFTHSAFQSIEKKAFQRRRKESPWRGGKIVFRTVIARKSVNSCNFWVPRPSGTGSWGAEWVLWLKSVKILRITCLKKLAVHRSIYPLTLFC